MQAREALEASKRTQKKQPVKEIQPRDNMNPLQNSISKCTIQGNKVLLPEEHLDNYPDVKKALIQAGGTYKNNAFIFPSDPTPLIDKLMNGASVNRKKELQFFETPEEVALFVVRHGFIQPSHLLGEFSAGRGALIKAARAEGHNNKFDVCEIDDINRAELEQLENVEIIGTDFLNVQPVERYDVILLNPPFSKNQDITHIEHAYKFLKPGGRLVAVSSKHWQYAKNRKETAFREWIEEIEGCTYEVDSIVGPQAFKKSGTNISTIVLEIDKPK